MNRLKIFSENLRRECARHNSIAAICRKANINRQQFNKYLAGSTFPSASVLHRICTALEIKSETLFANVEPVASDSQSSIWRQFSPLLEPVFGNAVNRFSDSEAMLAGDYFCYFPLHRVPHMLVRSYLRVSRNANVISFVRLTLFANISSKGGVVAKGRHKGLVLSNGNEINLIGLNRYPPHQMSFMTIDTNIGMADRHYAGTIMTRSGNSQLPSKFCLVPIPSNTPFRTIRNKLGIIHESQVKDEAFMLSTLMEMS